MKFLKFLEVFFIRSEDEENHLKEKEGLHVYGFLKDLPSLPE